MINFRKQSKFCVEEAEHMLTAPPCKTAGSINAAHQWYRLDAWWAYAPFSDHGSSEEPGRRLKVADQRLELL